MSYIYKAVNLINGAVSKKSHKITIENTNTGETITFASKAEMERTIHCNTKTITEGKTSKNGWKLHRQEPVSTIPDECMEVGAEIGTAVVLGNEAAENRSEELSQRTEDIVSTSSDAG